MIPVHNIKADSLSLRMNKLLTYSQQAPPITEGTGSHLCNGWNGQQPLACLNIVVPVYGWIRYFEKRISNYFWCML